jgi:hypothetical protein
MLLKTVDGLFLEFIGHAPADIARTVTVRYD